MGILDLFRRKKQPGGGPSGRIQRMFLLFQGLLDANSSALALMADLEEKLSGDYLFDMHFLRSRTEALHARMAEIVTALAQMSGNKWPELATARSRIEAAVAAEITRHAAPIEGPPVVSLAELASEQAAALGGGKAAGVAAALSIGLPVPAGFAVTLSAHRRFLAERGSAETGLGERIRSVLAGAGSTAAEQEAAAAEVRRLVLAAPLPPDLEEAIFSAYRRLCPRGEPVAVRSSASREDSALTFAGQFTSVLGVTEEGLGAAYREVVASQFSPRALFYLKSQGLEPLDLGMAVLCQRLVAPVAAGVLFTLEPDRCTPESEARMIVSAAWGLAQELVSGQATGDRFLVSRQTGEVVEESLAEKPYRLEALGTELVRLPVAEGDVLRPALAPELLRRLRDYGLSLEEARGGPQDIEWAWDGATLWVVQSRPLRLSDPLARCSVELARAAAGAEVLLSGATPGAFGVAAGPVYLAAIDPPDIERVPQGAVLVVAHTSPRLAPLLPKVAAMVAEVGAATGHLALLAREFGTPLLVDARGALKILPAGQVVTVDAHAGRVLRGRQEAMLRLLPRRDPLLAATPIYGRLKAVANLIVPLNLVDARQPNFRAAACRTYHDIARFAHEKGVELMFGVIDDVDLRHDAAVVLESHLPLNLHIVDLGGGLREGAGPKRVQVADILSVPMLALWRGMTHPGINWSGPVPVDLGGLFHIIAQTAIRPPEEYWDKTYALVAESYVNFSSRLGYHYNSVDSYCGLRRNDNYVNFNFKGGAADEPRRCRRATLIAKILEALGFEVEARCDLVRATFRKNGRRETEERLDLLGRLMGFVRQMDMIMSSDAAIDILAERFLSGNYSRDEVEEKVEGEKAPGQG